MAWTGASTQFIEVLPVPDRRRDCQHHAFDSSFSTGRAARRHPTLPLASFLVLNSCSLPLPAVSPSPPSCGRRPPLRTHGRSGSGRLFRSGPPLPLVVTRSLAAVAVAPTSRLVADLLRVTVCHREAAPTERSCGFGQDPPAREHRSFPLEGSGDWRGVTSSTGGAGFVLGDGFFFYEFLLGFFPFLPPI